MRQTNDPRFSAWWATATLPAHADRSAAAKVWQAAVENRNADPFDDWWTGNVLTRASCLPIHIDAARAVWTAADHG